MFSIEYKQSAGCASEHQYHRNVVDLYILYKDDKKIYSEKPLFHDYYFIIEINNLDKEINMVKHGEIYDVIYNNDLERGTYAVRYEDCASIIDDLAIYIEEVKEMLNIQDYNIRLYV